MPLPSAHQPADLVAALTALEQDADARGWDALPQLLGLFDTPVGVGRRRVTVEALPVDESVWRQHANTVPGLLLPYWVGLQAITAHLTSPAAPAWPHAWARRHGRRLVGIAFLAEGLDATHAATDNEHPGYPQSEPVDVPVRALTACDIDGGHYQILRVRGAAMTTVTVLDDPPAAIRCTVIVACLRRLTAALAS